MQQKNNKTSRPRAKGKPKGPGQCSVATRTAAQANRTKGQNNANDAAQAGKVQGGQQELSK